MEPLMIMAGGVTLALGGLLVRATIKAKRLTKALHEAEERLADAQRGISSLVDAVFKLNRKLVKLDPPWETREEKRLRLVAEAAALQERGSNGRFAKKAAVG